MQSGRCLIDPKSILQKDNDHKHTATVIKNYLQRGGEQGVLEVITGSHRVLISTSLNLSGDDMKRQKDLRQATFTECLQPEADPLLKTVSKKELEKALGKWFTNARDREGNHALRAQRTIIGGQYSRKLSGERLDTSAPGISTMSYLPALFKYVDEHQDEYVQRLGEWVAVQSVSAWPEKRGEIKKMMEMAAKDIERLGGTTELVDIGKQKMPGGEEIPLPPIILGRLGSDPGKKTVCIYGHLDVQPAHIEDGWDSEPFTLVERDGKLYGRGSTDDKGPVLAWFNVIEAFQKIGQEQVLMHRWRYPSLSLHGIEGAFSAGGAKTVIPRKVIGKFSIRLVPDMDPKVVEEQVVSYLNKKFAELESPNKMKVTMGHGAKAWVSDFNHPHYMAGRKAMKTVFGVEPDLTREGGSIPVTLTFQEATGRNVMLLPVGSSDDGAHSQNEKLNRSNYIQGTKMLGAYFHEVSQLS
ncbi:cytosolic non-specific dipeptidase [Silurus meridionalis]|nr:cytosolic non-specific dipeptidase [Silurus meridionalis]